MHGVFLDLESVDRGDLDLVPLRECLPDWTFHARTSSPEHAVERLARADVVVVNKVELNASVISQCSHLRLICVAATGTNNVDLAAAAAHGISVCNVRGYSTASVAQHVFALTLALVTRLPQYHQAVARGDWGRSNMFCLLDYPIQEIAGMTLGIIGYGALGRAVADVSRAFGMQVLIAQRPGGEPMPDRIALEQLLPLVDVLSLHCPLTPQTQGLIGTREFGLIKKGAILINTARGGIVDELALASALRSGRLAGAGVDVLTCEPPLPDNPLLASDIPNLIVTPHIAWASVQSRQRLLGELASNIQGFVAGEPRNLVV